MGLGFGRGMHIGGTCTVRDLVLCNTHRRCGVCLFLGEEASSWVKLSSLQSDFLGHMVLRVLLLLLDLGLGHGHRA